MSNGIFSVHLVYFYGRADLVESYRTGQINQIRIGVEFQKLFGHRRSFYFLDRKGTTYVFGDNSKGQLGLGFSSYLVQDPSPLKMTYLQLAPCDSYVYAHAQDGLYFWGDAQYGCAPTRKHIPEPTFVTQRNVTQIVSQNTRFHFIEQNDLYGCGLATIIGTKLPKISTSKPILVLSKVIQVACSNSHTLVLSETGNIYAWGSALSGELGHQQSGYHFKGYLSRPQLIEGISEVKQISCHDQYSLALTNTGELFEWGKGYSSKEGEEMSFEEALRIKRVHFQENSHITKVDCGTNCSACIDQLGRLYFWGQEYQKRIQVPSEHRCEEFKCGESVVFFIANTAVKKVSHHFKQNVQGKLKKVKQYVELKNSKIRNNYYDDQKQMRCLLDIHANSLKQDPPELKVEDLMHSRKQIARKPSQYMIELQRRQTCDVGQILHQKRLSRRVLSYEQADTMQDSSVMRSSFRLRRLSDGRHDSRIDSKDLKQDSKADSKHERRSTRFDSKIYFKRDSIKDSKLDFSKSTRWTLTQVNPKLKQAMMFDQVNDLILESERSVPLYIPFESNALKRYRIMSQQAIEKSQKEQVGGEDPEIIKYEYIARVENGFEQKQFLENMKSKEDIFVQQIRQTRRFFNDTSLYQKKYMNMKQNLDKKISEMNKIIVIQDN